MPEFNIAAVFKKGVTTTYKGIEIDLTNPDVTDVTIEDIAHSLSLLCRWNGTSENFFSVAEHSVMVAELLPPSSRLGGLMHDSEESILGDNISPLKEIVPELVTIGNELRTKIIDKFDIYYDHMLIKRADREQLKWEYNNVIIGKKKGLSPKAAERLFLRKFKEYLKYNKIVIAMTDGF